jgi:parallel beta-helix repeat protein
MRISAQPSKVSRFEMLRNSFIACIVFLAIATGMSGQYPAIASPQSPIVLQEAETIRLANDILDRRLPKTTNGSVSLIAASSDGSVRRFFRTGDKRPDNWRDRAIVLESGTHDLESIQATLPEPGWLDCSEAGCTLSAPIVVRPGAILVIADTKLRMLQEEGAAILSYGELYISGAEIEGWNASLNGPADTDEKGGAFRPFIVGLGGTYSLIRSSRLAHLGYQKPASYGLSFATHNRERGPTVSPSVDMILNQIVDVYFGFFTFDADGVRVIGNRIEYSHVYAIDPHDDTRNMFIAENVVSGSTRSHGIILSRRIHKSAVRNNKSFLNAGAGIFIDKASHDITVSGNEVFLNGTDGIVVHESRAISISGNIVRDNASDGVRIRASAEIEITTNRVARNGRYGVMAYDWSAVSKEPRDEEREQILSVSVKVEGNSISNNARGVCEFRGEVSLLAAASSDC